MNKTPRICPRCAAFLKKGTAKCPECGMSFETEKQKAVSSAEQDKTVPFKTDPTVMQSNSKQMDKKKKTYNNKAVNLGFEVKSDKQGKLEINTDDVTFTGPAPRSVKEARGDTIPPKLKWWEIYKWADRMLARRKIKKVVNKAATEVPPTVSNGKMFLLCLLLGWLGIHSLYAKNYTRGFIVMGFMISAIVVISVDVLKAAVGISIGGGFGFVVVFMWAIDLVRILMKKYRYRTSKEKFIEKLNFSTRAKLGRKYIKSEIKKMEAKNAA